MLNKYIELYWLISFLITQLCIEKIDITYYLYIIDWTDSSQCLYNLSIQIIHYMLMKCLQIWNLRKKLLRWVNDIKKILWNSALVKVIIIFILWSNLLKQFQTVKKTSEDLTFLDAVWNRKFNNYTFQTVEKTINYLQKCLFFIDDSERKTLTLDYKKRRLASIRIKKNMKNYREQSQNLY